MAGFIDMCPGCGAAVSKAGLCAVCGAKPGAYTALEGSWEPPKQDHFPACPNCGKPITPRNRVDIEEFKDICYACYSKKPKHVYVDFDGVLAEYTGWKGPEYLGAPRPGCKEFLAKIKSLGFTVVIFTTRRTGAIQVWLREHDLWHLVSKVTNEKGPALVYLDDRAICFEGDYGAALWKLVRFTPYWKNKP